MTANIPVTVTGDFADPLSYLASQRVTRLRSLGVDVTWCAVTAHPRLPRAVTPLREAAALAAAAAALPLEIVPTAGTLVPNSGAASAAYAEALTESLAEAAPGPLSLADRMRAALFDALWVEHLRVDDPEVLRRIVFDIFDAGYARQSIGRRVAANKSLITYVGSDPLAASRRTGYIVTLAGAPLTTVGQRRLDGWQAAWKSAGTPELPMLTTGHGDHLSGPDALRRLEQLLAPVAETRIPPFRQPVTVDVPLGSHRAPIGAA